MSQCFVFLTDPHITNSWPDSRKDDFLSVILGKLAWCVHLANEANASIIMGGDLLNKYNLRPGVVNAAMRVLREARNPIFSIIGNHDIYGQNYTVADDLLIGTLFSSGLVKLLDKDPYFLPVVDGSDKVIQLTGFSYLPNIDKSPAAYEIQKSVDKNVVCAIHVVHGFLLANPWKNLAADRYTVIEAINTEADIVCVGHEHQGFGIQHSKNTTFVNPGSLGRISSNLKEIVRVPKVAVINVYVDEYTVDLVNVPAPQGADVLDREAIKAEMLQKQKLAEFRNSLGETVLSDTIDLNELFTAAAEKLKISEDVLKVSLNALDAHDASLLGKKGKGE